MKDEFEKLCAQARKCRWMAPHMAPDDAERLFALALEFERRASELQRMTVVEKLPVTAQGRRSGNTAR